MKAIENAVKNAIKLKRNEKVLIIYDKQKEDIAKLFADGCEKITKNVILARMYMRKITSREPPRSIVKLMKDSDIVLGFTTLSLTHTKAVREALKFGARVSTSPNITRQMLPAIDIDYKELSRTCKRLKRYFLKNKIIKVETPRGTSIKMKYGKTRKIQMQDGIMDHPGSLHNLPAGECGVAPFETKSNGKVVIDGAMVGIGVLKHPIEINVHNGRIERIIGSRKLINIFRAADKNARTLAEFSIGLNPRAKIIGNVLMDEKVYGTCHVAFGDNISLGGANQSNVHLDGIMKKPSIWLGKKLVMKDGELRI
ncbi:MAG: aminopeptidase [Candidatus Hodarchaeales archaeon]|jgi:leucyl aminopeptidase (aminopeptidase T)